MSLALRKVDLLITNTHMQGLAGRQLIRRVRRELPDLPILYIKNADEHGGSPDGLPLDVVTLRDPFTAEDCRGAAGHGAFAAKRGKGLNGGR